VSVRVRISFPEGGEREVLLPSIPRKDERIRLANGSPAGTVYVVTLVEWQEGADEPPIVAVREAPPSR